ncbi:MAG: hypothetical protein KH020_20490 [Clostridiales bacterium]|nr:hypothetical protein [Clostridiales bacterium]
MKKIKSRTIFFVVAVIAVGIIVFSQSDFIGISASHVEEDARKSQRIPDSWEVVQSRNDELYALLLYDPDNKGAYTYSLYENKKRISFGYSFRSGGDLSGISNTAIKYVYDNKGCVLVSLNKQRIQKIERDNGELDSIQVDTEKPVVVVFPVNSGILKLYDETGKEVLYETVVEKW